jgi:hypothetical protein
MASPTNTEAIKAAMADPSNDMPADLTLAFLQESKDRGAVIAILIITSFVLIVVTLRSYARCSSVRGFGLDDWLALLALVSRLYDFTAITDSNARVGYADPVYRARRDTHQLGIWSTLCLHPICSGQCDR